MAPHIPVQDVRSQDFAKMLGIIGTLCWSFRLFFQLHNNFRRRKVLELDGLNRGAFVSLVSLSWFLWAVFSQMTLGVSAVVARYSVALAVQPHINVFAVFVLFGQLFIYEFGSSKIASFVLLAIMMTLVASFEATYLLHAKAVCSAQQAPFCAMGLTVVAIVFLVSGWLPLYVESFRHQGRAVSVSWVALTFGVCAALHLMAAMTFQHPAHALSVAVYASTLALESGLLIAHMIWLVRTRKIRKEAAALGKSFDELAADYAKHGVALHWAASRQWTPAQEESQVPSARRTRRTLRPQMILPQQPDRACVARTHV